MLHSLQIFSVIALLLVGGVFYKGNLSEKAMRRVRIGMGVYLLLCESAYQVVMVWGGSYDITFDLPLHLCSVMVLVGGVALIKNWTFVLRLLALPFVAGPILALAMPFVPDGSPFVRYAYYFSYHIVLISAGMFIAWVQRENITTKTIWQSFGWMLVLWFVSMWYNHLTGGNYLFTAKPVVDVWVFRTHYSVYFCCFAAFITLDLWVVYLLFMRMDSLVKGVKGGRELICSYFSGRKVQYRRKVAR